MTVIVLPFIDVHSRKLFPLFHEQPDDVAFHSAVGILNNCGKSPLVYKDSFQKFGVARKLHVFLDSTDDSECVQHIHHCIPYQYTYSSLKI